MTKQDIIDILNNNATAYLGGMEAIVEDNFESIAEEILDYLSND